eukprot:CAMPEP_0202913010 /NCGR_PEP_ID=MMETSP1392-20130828/59297_1 /ASSEMBLY_ACC=CAM_ASM_000868 /TAXON_ID=225041 /ORGANISM="Chlamydomonas chlamydogama, Strain SAG 11-48b" /LENGTH=54 /DNA_ID=CAMNT_0049604123 /DNA_START=106 /DNA_END=267 /DNA_ORIENTATION=+
MAEHSKQVAKSLEKLMSERYGVPLQAGSIRNIQGNKLVANIDKPGDEAMYSQAE